MVERNGFDRNAIHFELWMHLLVGPVVSLETCIDKPAQGAAHE